MQLSKSCVSLEEECTSPTNGFTKKFGLRFFFHILNMNGSFVQKGTVDYYFYKENIWDCLSISKLNKKINNMCIQLRQPRIPNAPQQNKGKGSDQFLITKLSPGKMARLWPKMSTFIGKVDKSSLKFPYCPVHNINSYTNIKSHQKEKIQR